jgi:hypothetical protein
VRLIDILSKLQRLDQPVLETADVAAIVGETKPHASKIAARLAEVLPPSRPHHQPLACAGHGLEGVETAEQVVHLVEAQTAHDIES